MGKPIDTKALGSIFAMSSICEALLLALIDQKIMTAKQVRDVLDDASSAHRDIEKTAGDVAAHREAVAVIKRLAASVKKADLS
jgi:hypothetical protein